jgi:hypothetical protein
VIKALVTAGRLPAGFQTSLGKDYHKFSGCTLAHANLQHEHPDQHVVPSSWSLARQAGLGIATCFPKAVAAPVAPVWSELVEVVLHIAHLDQAPVVARRGALVGHSSCRNRGGECPKPCRRQITQRAYWWHALQAGRIRRKA